VCFGPVVSVSLLSELRGTLLAHVVPRVHARDPPGAVAQPLPALDHGGPRDLGGGAAEPGLDARHHRREPGANLELLSLRRRLRAGVRPREPDDPRLRGAERRSPRHGQPGL
jgi:hypothetical protein